MGIPSQFARAILREHRYRPITGALLSISRQTVYLNPEQACDLVREELGTPPRVQSQGLELDVWTRGAQAKRFISDRAFYSLFSDADYNCVDVTPYEGATLIANLCNPLPAEIEGQFDFIVNGSSLDNIFDPAMALRNLSRLLKPGGRIIHLERASRAHNVYVAFALSWFHDYYAINNFEDCQAYLVQWDTNTVESRWDVYRYSPVLEREGRIEYFGEDCYYYPHRGAHCLVLAEKGQQSTWEKSPIQFGYRPGMQQKLFDGQWTLPPQTLPADEDDPYFRSALRFFRSERSAIVSVAEKVSLPDHLFYYAPQIPYCGSIHPVGDAVRQ